MDVGVDESLLASILAFVLEDLSSGQAFFVAIGVLLRTEVEEIDAAPGEAFRLWGAHVVDILNGSSISSAAATRTRAASRAEKLSSGPPMAMEIWMPSLSSVTHASSRPRSLVMIQRV